MESQEGLGIKWFMLSILVAGLVFLLSETLFLALAILCGASLPSMGLLYTGRVEHIADRRRKLFEDANKRLDDEKSSVRRKTKEEIEEYANLPKQWINNGFVCYLVASVAFLAQAGIDGAYPFAIQTQARSPLTYYILNFLVQMEPLTPIVGVAVIFLLGAVIEVKRLTNAVSDDNYAPLFRLRSFIALLIVGYFLVYGVVYYWFLVLGRYLP